MLKENEERKERGEEPFTEEEWLNKIRNDREKEEEAKKESSKK